MSAPIRSAFDQPVIRSFAPRALVAIAALSFPVGSLAAQGLGCGGPAATADNRGEHAPPDMACLFLPTRWM